MNNSIPVILLLTLIGTKMGGFNAIRQSPLSRVVSITGEEDNEKAIEECLETFSNRPYFKDMIKNLSRCVISNSNRLISYKMSKQTFINAIDVYYQTFKLWQESEPVYFGRMDTTVPINAKWLQKVNISGVSTLRILIIRDYLYSKNIYFTGNLLRIPNVVYDSELQSLLGFNSMSRKDYCDQIKWIFTLITRFNAYSNDDVASEGWMSTDNTIDNLMAHYSAEAQKGLVESQTSITGGRSVNYITEALSIQTFYVWDSIIGSHLVLDKYKALKSLKHDIENVFAVIFEDMSSTQKSIPEFMPPRELHLIFDLMAYRSGSGDIERVLKSNPAHLWR